jgi:hypothetical protein
MKSVEVVLSRMSVRCVIGASSGSAINPNASYGVLVGEGCAIAEHLGHEADDTHGVHGVLGADHRRRCGGASERQGHRERERGSLCRDCTTISRS